MTNGDRIRAMSDEKLLRFFHYGACAYCPAYKVCTEPADKVPCCYTTILGWLKQEVKE